MLVYQTLHLNIRWITDAKTLFDAPLQIKTTNASTGGPIDIDIATFIDNRIDSRRHESTTGRDVMTCPCVNARILNNLLLVYCVVLTRCHWYKQTCLTLRHFITMPVRFKMYKIDKWIYSFNIHTI